MADYCTATQVKAAGRLNISGTTYDTELAALVTAASRWIDQATWHITDAFAASATTTRYFREEDIDGQTLVLDAPLLSASTVTNGDTVVVSSTNYWLTPRNAAYRWGIQLKSGYSWAIDTDGEISVAGVWGFSTTVPDPIREATAMLAGWMFKRFQAALQDNAASPELGQIVYGEAIPKQVMALIQPYKRGPA
jgi:hypothetical protein